jgi:hypothetical protein
MIVSVEVPEDFTDYDNVAEFINGALDNAPAPEEIDESIKDVEIGIVYFGGVVK